MSTTRTILHVDMDAFFVSVELLRRPELRGLPVVVGGTGPRGVVAAASYEARRYGVFSAMPSSRARRLCPDAVFLSGDHAHYGEVSTALHEVFETVTPFIEPLSLDEAFLDVTGSVRLLGDGVAIAQRLRADVRERTGLGCSVGVASNKFIAKLASEAAKPQAGPDGVREGKGVVEVRPGDELAFLHPLPVTALWGVGPATLEKLDRIGVRTVRDLAQLDESVLVGSVGRVHGQHLHRLAHARDDRPVDVDRATKSIGHEETFAADRYTHDELRRELVRLADAVAARLRAHGVGARTLSLKVRFAGFQTVTRSVTVPAPVDTAHALRTALEPLLVALDPTLGVRLLGVSTSNFGMPAEQLALGIDSPEARSAEEAAEWQAAEHAVDEIRERFGRTAIGPASAVDATGLRLVRKGAQQWGPDDTANRPDGTGNS
ncbi:MAG TPA: DNA polymerase IV [Ilumatobacteraceae bacterium]|nr:DNA polymerase IV [Ilumatobacteraceae bacterium]